LAIPGKKKHNKKKKKEKDGHTDRQTVNTHDYDCSRRKEEVEDVMLPQQGCI
jgi:hypothetical protein